MKTRASLLLIVPAMVAFWSYAQAQTNILEGTNGHINMTGNLSWTPPANLSDGANFFWWPAKGVLRIGDFQTSYQTDTLFFGFPSIMIGKGVARGDSSVAIGYGASSVGQKSVALGADAYASDSCSAAITGGYAMGPFSFAVGGGYAKAWGSNALGPYTHAFAIGSTAIGICNLNERKDRSPVTFSWSNIDPIFEVANGSAGLAGQPAPFNSNAFTVYRDGSAKVSGDLIVGGGLTTEKPFIAPSYVASGGIINGSPSSGLILNASGTNQNLALVTSGTGKVCATSAGDSAVSFLANSIGITMNRDHSNGLYFFRESFINVNEGPYGIRFTDTLSSGDRPYFDWLLGGRSVMQLRTLGNENNELCLNGTGSGLVKIWHDTGNTGTGTFSLMTQSISITMDQNASNGIFFFQDGCAQTDGPNTFGIRFSSGTGCFDWLVSDNSAIHISRDSRVGIGTSNPDKTLTVNGGIHCKELLIDTNVFADYVFAKDYRLASLGEVEAHIQKKGHLPGVPSAQEACAKGVNVGEMQTLLLQKIEELTLYMIEQEKRIARLESENTALKRLR